MRGAAAALAGLLALTGCDRRPDDGPVVASVIGATPRFGPTLPLRQPDRVLAAAIAEGLVGFDAAGQIEPGLAERWIVIDGGLRYIFRLRPAQWRDGDTVTAAQVVTILKRRLRDPDNRLRPFLSAIDEVVEMTPQVLEIRLSRPRPDLLKLFAQPELTLARARPPGGGGPFRVERDDPRLVLRPAPDPDRDDGQAAEPEPADDVELIGERAALAVARFQDRQSDLVLGGTFVDWPLVGVAGIAPANVRIDPAAGLLGLAVMRRDGFLADPATRAALAGAIDRAALAAAFAPGTTAAEAILPERLDSAASVVQPRWSTQTFADRQANARRLVAAWQASKGAPPQLSIALPAGPGANRLFRLLRAALGAVGIDTVQMPLTARTADLRLIDEVAPYDSARWYLRTACAPCGEAAEAAVEAARTAPTPDERARAIALADVALAEDAAFIPLLRPVRWSLAALRLTGFQGNARAWHPLEHLRNDPD